ncbi:MAG: hydantoinase/oxoprolinase family protein [Thermomicrobiales bacterium]
MTPTLRVAVDIGGTFTDVVAFDAASRTVWAAKASTTPANFADGVFAAIAAGAIRPEDIAAFIHGTTVVINAITLRRGVKTALITTEGFRDVLEIGRGNRPDMYNLKFHKPRPFVPRRLRFEVRERVAADGSVWTSLAMDDLERIAAACEAEQVAAIAICFLHAYAHPEHEQTAAAFLRQRLPEVTVTASSEITREWREFERSSTTVLNAYVAPILDAYLSDLERRLRLDGVAAPLFAMLSNGGTATFTAARQTPIALVESGPVAGVTAAAELGKAIGDPNVIALDIGGTTAKCSLIEGGEARITTDYRLEASPRSSGYPIKAPVVDIVEIGSGGGSIAWFDPGGALRVGPLSAGADPGPACYGRGGTEPTVTDALLITGVLDADYFLGGRLQVDPALARRAYEPIAARLGVSVDEAAAGVIRVANEQTIDALKLISVRRGYDPRDFTLVAFGGGGPTHAASFLADLGVRRIVIPPFPGTFSAWGMLLTSPRVDRVQTRVLPLATTAMAELARLFAAAETEAIAALTAQGFPREVIAAPRRSLDMRYHGQEHTVDVPLAGPHALAGDSLAAAFHDRHRRRYTFALEETAIEIVNLRITATAEIARPTFGAAAASRGDARKGTRRVHFSDGHGAGTPRVSTPVYDRDRLAPGFAASGPLIVEEPSTTTLVHPGQRLTVDDLGNLVITVAGAP